MAYFSQLKFEVENVFEMWEISGFIHRVTSTIHICTIYRNASHRCIDKPSRVPGNECLYRPLLHRV